MIRSVILSKARKLANDVDTTNPFHSDAECHGILDDWALEMAGELNLPRYTQTITFTQGQGGVPSSGKTLSTDILGILDAICYKTATDYDHKNIPVITEQELDGIDPAWRSRTEQGVPSYAVICDAITAAAAAFTGRTITFDKRVDATYYLIINYIQLPAASTDGTKSPEFNPAMHACGMYFLAWHMLEPRNAERAERMRNLYERARRKAKTLSPFIQADNEARIWGDYPDLG